MHRISTRRLLQASIAGVFWAHLVGNPMPVHADTWIGGNNAWSDGGNVTFWNSADEPDPDDDATFNAPDTVTLASNNDVATLNLSGGVSLSTNGFDLTVGGLVHLTGADTTLAVGGGTSLLRVDNLQIDNGGGVRMNGGVMTLDELGGNGLLDINAGGILAGNGTINFTDAPMSLTTLIVNDGVIAAQSDLIGDAPPVGTLLLNATSPNARIDLDGTGSGGVINVLRNQTLDINMNVTDAVGGSINLFHNATLDISTPWMIDFGTISISTGQSGLIPADVAFIGGGTLTQTGGRISVADADGALQFNAPFVLSAGSLQTSGRVIFNSNARIASGAMVGGGGTVVVASGGHLSLDMSAHLLLTLRNQGSLSTAGDTAVAEASVNQFEQSETGRFHVQLAGTGSSIFAGLGLQHDRLNVIGHASLEGDLQISLLNSFVPIPGDEFYVLSYGSRTGEVDLINDTGIMGLTFAPTYGANFLTLTAGWFLPGDADMNSVVDLRDLYALASHWLAPGNWLDGDFDGDGFVDKADLTILAQNWQAGVDVQQAALGLGLEQLTIPEPGTVLCGIVLLFLPRRRGAQESWNKSSCG